jgi:hypothetical protein
VTVLELLKEQFNGHVAFRERRPGVVQVIAPLFHEDGNMVDIFIDEPHNGNSKFRVGDHGMTLVRLTYTYDLDTENKQRIFKRILAENHIQEQNGRLSVEAEPDRLYPAILHFAQTVAKVSGMQYFKRKVIQSLFYEQLAEFIEERLGADMKIQTGDLLQPRLRWARLSSVWCPFRSCAMIGAQPLSISPGGAARGTSGFMVP